MKGSQVKLILWPDEILQNEAEEVKDISEVRHLLDPMVEIMRGNDGVGLAAPQVGVLKKLIVWEFDEEEPSALINPKVEMAGGFSKNIEGCLSLPGVSVEITRPKRIVVSGFNLKGDKIRLDLVDKKATIISHEMDHLSGRVIIDYLSPTDRSLAEKAIKEEVKRYEEQYR